MGEGVYAVGAGSHPALQRRTPLVRYRQRQRRDRPRAIAPRGLEIGRLPDHRPDRSEEHTSELQSLMRISYAVFCLKNKKSQQMKSLTTSNINKQHPPK